MINFRCTMRIVVIAFLLPISIYAQKLDSDLLKASKKGQVEKVQILIKSGASVNATDKNKWTALMFAADKGHADVVKLLLENGADFSATDYKGESVQNKAVKKKNIEVVMILEFFKAKQENTITSYNQFLSKYPNSKLSIDAKNGLINLEFQITKEANSIEDYEQFLSKYPNSEYSNDAKNLLFTIKTALEQALKENTIEAYVTFFEKYPHTQSSNRAFENLEKFLFEKASKENTYKSYEYYIAKCPNGAHIEIVKRMLDDLKSNSYYISHSNWESEYIKLRKTHPIMCLALEDMAGVYGLNSNISETDSDYGIKKAQQIYVSW